MGRKKRKRQAGHSSHILTVFVSAVFATIMITCNTRYLGQSFTDTVFDIPADLVAAAAPKKETFHILHGLKGKKKGFIDQWEANLKSVLLNAPIDLDMHIHIMSDNDATEAIRQRLDIALLSNSTWRNQISITSYNVEAYHKEWTTFLLNKTRGAELYQRISLGGYYRMMAFQILPKHEGNEHIGAILYMDTDVVVLTNLNDLVQYIDRENEELLYQWSGTWPNSGFMIFHLDRFHKFWDLLDQVPKLEDGVDQTLMTHVHNTFPHTTGILPSEFDTHLGHGWRKHPYDLLEMQEKVGILHFTGRIPQGESYFDSENGVQKYCLRHPMCRDYKNHSDLFHQTWGLSDYYSRIPWKWVRYFGSSTTPPHMQGRSIKINFIQG